MSIELHPVTPAHPTGPSAELEGVRLACDLYAACLSEPMLPREGPVAEQVITARELFSNLLTDLWHLTGSYGLDLWAMAEEAEATAREEWGRAAATTASEHRGVTPVGDTGMVRED